MYDKITPLDYLIGMKQSKQEKKGAPFSIRLTPDVEERLTKSAEKVKLSKASLAQAAIEAAVEAIEANGGKIVLPLSFTTTHEAVVKQKPSAPTLKAPGPTIYSYPEPQKINVAETKATGSDS